MFFFCTADNDLSARLKNTPEDADGIAQANQSLPVAQSQSDQSVDCGSNTIQPGTQEQNNAQSTSEVSSSHDQPVSTTSGGVSSSVNYSDSDEADDCPVFEYSAESMQVVKDGKESPDSTPNNVEQSVEDNMENDEDLVQLDDDENFGNETGISEEHVNQTQRQIEAEQSIESPVASPETTTTNTGTESPTTAPANKERESSEATASKTKSTDDGTRSDEQIAGDSEAQPKTDGHKGNNENSNVGIEGMETEMISEDEHELHDDHVAKENKADKENNNQKSDRDDSFKKVSKSNKDRNYRDKKDKIVNKSRERNRRSKSRSSVSRSRSRSRFRSRSRSRSRSRNRNRRDNKRSRRKDYREKRQEMQRYDVRTLIADRQPRSIKDKYGRDTSRPPRSITPRRGRSQRSLSRSISPGWYRVIIILLVNE